ncbi:hypothetical protein FWF48_04235 [Candidatus Saccharibacteria bacterium]|nr:hypothetical protein [Candidatus Saccharibacteria bacterium]
MRKITPSLTAIFATIFLGYLAWQGKRGTLFPAASKLIWYIIVVFAWVVIMVITFFWFWAVRRPSFTILVNNDSDPNQEMWVDLESFLPTVFFELWPPNNVIAMRGQLADGTTYVSNTDLPTVEAAMAYVAKRRGCEIKDLDPRIE